MVRPARQGGLTWFESFIDGATFPARDALGILDVFQVKLCGSKSSTLYLEKAL